MFTSIISKFKGKVLLVVDFWATWCGPCRMANKMMVPMKEELKGKDIVYLYITGETSPLKTWENMIPDIHGEHFRLTDTQWKLPLGRIQDRRGTDLSDCRPRRKHHVQANWFPGSGKMKEELLKVTK